MRLRLCWWYRIAPADKLLISQEIIDAIMACMQDIRKYGKKPFSTVVVHGGPGAAGEMAQVARAISSSLGVLEPMQAALSIQGQVAELKDIIYEHANLPVILLGFSWGAWLSYIFTGTYPELVKKLILIGSGPFEEEFVKQIKETRLERLENKDREEVKTIIEMMRTQPIKNIGSLILRMSELFAVTDAYNPDFTQSDAIDFRADIHAGVWKEAAELRKCGKLLKTGSNITCPVLAIHGDYDPHPAAGVHLPLSAAHSNFRFILLKKCGHKPWIEKEAKEEFFQILKEELD
ncbi:alpha/beta fold hydrolase [Candidatus Riflebacteria bacterium]